MNLRSLTYEETVALREVMALYLSESRWVRSATWISDDMRAQIAARRAVCKLVKEALE